MSEYIYTNLPLYVKTNSRTEFSSSVVSSGAVLLFSENGSSLTAKLPDGSFVEVGGSGGTDVSSTTAEAADVLAGKVFFTSGGVMTSGTIPTVSASKVMNVVVVPSGFIASEETLVVGNLTSGGTITPATENQIISSGTFLDGSITILGDVNLVGSNIVSGVSIFGVSGTYSGGGSSGAEVITLGYITSGGQFQPVQFYGQIAVNSGAAVSGLSCYSFNTPTAENVSSGVIVSAGTQTVESGWLWIDTTVTDSGQVWVFSGGTMQNVSLSGSNTFVSSGIYSSGGGCFISAGGSAYDATVSSGGLFHAGIGGYASRITVLSGGICIPHNNGIMDDITVSSGGYLEVWSNGSALNVTSNAGANVIVHDGGMITYK